MDCTYLEHSAFLLETEQTMLLFDYTGEKLHLSDDKDLVVLVSHHHGDHFTPEIFSYAKRSGRTRFILSTDINARHVPKDVEASWMGPHEQLLLGELEVHTLQSTDEGVAFVLTVEGRTIYFAADLNNWHWEGESDEYNRQMDIAYKEELKLLPEKLDLAFVPVDPRLGAYYSLGAKDLLMATNVRTLIPMHFWKDYSVCAKLIAELKDLPVTVVDVQHEKQTWRNL